MLRAAVVGVGYLGNFHAQKYKKLSEEAWQGKLSLVGVCDAYPEQANKVAQSLGVEAYTRAEDLIGRVDCVTIAAVTSMHYKLAKLFLENKIHVNVEKPMTVTVSEAKELIEIAQKNNCVLAVGHSERFNPLYSKLKSMMDKPLWAELHRHAPFRERGSDVSVLHDLAIHDLDMAFDLFGDDLELKQVAMGELLKPTPDWSNFTLYRKDSLQVLISVSRVAPSMSRSIKIVEKNRILFADFQTNEITTTLFESSAQEPITIQKEIVAKADNLYLETENFLTAVKEGRAPAVTGQHGLRALSMVEQVLSFGKKT